jgi:hypothetical protein
VIGKTYGLAWAFFSRHWVLLVLFAVLMEAVPLVVQSVGSTADVGVLTLIAYYMHRFMLFGEEVGTWKVRSAGPPRKQAVGWFFLSSVTMLLFWIGAAGVLIFRLQAHGADNATNIIAAFILALPIYYLLLVIFGTALPAAAAGDRFGPVTTLRRAWRTALPIAGGLLGGPVLFGALALTLFVVIAARLDVGDSSTIAGFASGVVSRMTGFFTTALAVAVLCQGYLKVAPPEIIAQTPW